MPPLQKRPGLKKKYYNDETRNTHGTDEKIIQDSGYNISEEEINLKI
jgi:hypothetical protein